MKTRNGQRRKHRIDVSRLLNGMKLEAVVRALKRSGARLASETLAPLVADCETRSRELLAAGEIGESRRLARRAAALNGLLIYGPDPSRMVAEVELPEGYDGKILMIVLNCGGFAGTVCLRSGDDWHREILRNTRAELKDLGFIHTRVDPLGGAYARFEPDGGIVIWGSSDEYGCCDKQEAARMIARTHPDMLVRIEE
jgi:hypothetical protein